MACRDRSGEGKRKVRGKHEREERKIMDEKVKESGGRGSSEEIREGKRGKGKVRRKHEGKENNGRRGEGKWRKRKVRGNTRGKTGKSEEN